MWQGGLVVMMRCVGAMGEAISRGTVPRSYGGTVWALLAVRAVKLLGVVRVGWAMMLVQHAADEVMIARRAAPAPEWRQAPIASS